MNLVFLDYDGVVNIPMFYPNEEEPRYFLPENNKVNNYQACRWISKLCKITNSKIVVSSTWRAYENYKECLYNGGLDKDIEIIGATGEMNLERGRGAEIHDFIKNFDEPIDHMVIIDDLVEDMDMYLPYSVKCNPYIGFTRVECLEAIKVLKEKIGDKSELL